MNKVIDVTTDCKTFLQLSGTEVFKLLKLRSEVFVVEQNCIFLDPDKYDMDCHHMLCWNGDTLIGCTRLLPPNVTFLNMSIGRVAVSPEWRGYKIGRLLMLKSIEKLYHFYGKKPITIGAQLYLKTFYESIGFKGVGNLYLEDGIEHIEMTLIYTNPN